MKCHETRGLLGPYLDSELDVRTSNELRQHLEACADCAQALATEEQAQAQVFAALRQGQATPPLWERIERLLREAEGTSRTARDLASGTVRRERGTQHTEPWWQFWLWPSPSFYAGVAAVWAVIFALNFSVADPAVASSPAATAPSPEARQAFAEHRRELAELLGVVAAPAAEPKPATSPPQSSLRRLDEKVRHTALAPDRFPWHAA